jgi:HlyD family secretion protein
MRNKKGLLIAVLILSALVILLFLFRIVGTPSFLIPETDENNTSVVDKGQVYITVDASGIVEPENEVILLCPYTSIIRQINKEPGSRVRKGETIIELDEEQIRNEIEQISDQLEVKANSLERSKLEGQMARIDLGYNVEVKKLKIASIKAQLADEEQLLSVGGISSAKIDETKQNLVLAEKDLDVVQKKNTIRLSQMRTEETGLNLQIGIQKKQLADKLEMLDKLKIKAPSDGIILTILGKEGEKVGNDKMLITMSDLTTFKIKGLIEEKYSEFIKTGSTVFVLAESGKLDGTIGNVTPTVAENKIQFNVHLDHSNNPELIPNQSIKMLVLKSSKTNVLRISSKNNFKANSTQTIYILDSGKVVSRNVEFGVKGSEYQEIISGLEAGDHVLLTDSPFSWKYNQKEKDRK